MASLSLIPSISTELFRYRRIKMSEIDEMKDEQVIRQFMKDQLNDRKEDKQENDNSFIFLEKDTLNMLMNHLLMNAEQSK